jgi:membrane-bound lytic murein transglycosylase B
LFIFKSLAFLNDQRSANSKASIRILVTGAQILTIYRLTVKKLFFKRLANIFLMAFSLNLWGQTNQITPTNGNSPALGSHLAHQSSKPHQKRPRKVRQIITETGPYFKRTPELLDLAQQISQANDLPKPWVVDQLLKAKSLSKIKQLVLPPSIGVKKNWLAYKERFLTESRIQGGIDYAQKNWAYLEKAQSIYQVPWEIIVAILGVETFYGQNMGHFKALDVLTSLSMDFPKSHPRAQERELFFRQELGALLKLMQTKPQQVWLSSYAGAMGLPQFMPSNWHKFAVDFDGDGRIDLNNSTADAIGSVGNYLAKFGWQPNMPTHFEIDPTFDKTHLQELLVPDILPSFRVQQLLEWGLVLTPSAQRHPGPLALVMLENGEDEAHYVLGTENFYTVTRYNWSSYYALAVIELSAAIKAAMRD